MTSTIVLVCFGSLLLIGILIYALSDPIRRSVIRTLNYHDIDYTEWG